MKVVKRKKRRLEDPDPIIDLIGDPYIEKIIPLLWKKAFQTYRRLPLGHRFWIEPEDLFQEAYMEAIRCFRIWDSQRDIQFITFVYRAIDNKMNSLLTYWGAKKRSPGIPVDLDMVNPEFQESVSDVPIDVVLQLLFSGR